MEKAFEGLGDDVVFLVLYTREPHPGEGDFFDCPQPNSYEEKLDYALRSIDELGIAAKMLVDDMDDAVHKMYGSLPNMAYVIDKEGRIAAKWSWIDPPSVINSVNSLRA